MPGIEMDLKEGAVLKIADVAETASALERLGGMLNCYYREAARMQRSCFCTLRDTITTP